MLTVLNINARSVLSETIEFEYILIEHNLDAVVITETWLNAGVINYEYLPPSFTVFVRTVGHKGRVLRLLLRMILTACEWPVSQI